MTSSNSSAWSNVRLRKRRAPTYSFCFTEKASTLILANLVDLDETTKPSFFSLRLVRSRLHATSHIATPAEHARTGLRSPHRARPPHRQGHGRRAPSAPDGARRSRTHSNTYDIVTEHMRHWSDSTIPRSRNRSRQRSGQLLHLHNPLATSTAVAGRGLLSGVPGSCSKPNQTKPVATRD